ncbi:hypothetical protein GUITHDRAFT_102596 [Guillardia theta CCMP2712]|uniref:Uncharacterized protein n=1 Tax=Guillardia theta (strain CCMP2712) TaxID=905079 RepID=L1JU87_GUITC|nr:hypothetical protein GUITHDRAFT_102596 [Guillardia theta CCMP2712]EKX51982.1 hypothetical protein GUITHDRAFT_102596 [Guillardia theta CCMP2712]|eukprot:XP_005838962.1 hypothetical protein GUITHDRAFT_102596 [Guillardia theta CCMP2712]
MVGIKNMPKAQDPSGLQAFLSFYGSCPSVSPVSSPSNLISDFTALQQAFPDTSFVEDWEELEAAAFADKYFPWDTIARCTQHSNMIDLRKKETEFRITQ